MSGGRFGYNQYRISEIADTIESVINRNGREKTKEELKNEGWRDSDWYKKYPEDLYYYKYPDEVIEKFKIAVKLLREAYVYAHRIDWLLSGDDGEDSFIERLKKDLKRNHEYSGVIKSTEYEFTPSTPTEPLATEALAQSKSADLYCFCANGGREGLHGICTNCGNYIARNSREGALLL